MRLTIVRVTVFVSIVSQKFSKRRKKKNSLDFVRVDASIDADDHAVLRLQHSRKPSEEVHSLMAMEISLKVSAPDR